METAVLSYARGADQQDVSALDKVFHKDFQVLAITPEGVRKLDKATYLKLIEAKKIGGTPREAQIESTHVDGPVAMVRLTLRSEKVVFHDHLTLLKENDHWVIVANVTRVTPR